MKGKSAHLLAQPTDSVSIAYKFQDRRADSVLPCSILVLNPSLRRPLSFLFDLFLVRKLPQHACLFRLGIIHFGVIVK